MRLIFSTIYCVIFSVVIFIYWAKNGPSDYVAATGLQKNRLLQSGDLKYSPQNVVDLAAGVYLKQSIERGKAVKASDVSHFPLMQTHPGSVTMLFPLDKTFVKSGSINAGTSVRLCVAGKPILDPARFNITAVLCHSDESGSCTSLVDIPADQLVKLANAISATSLPSPRPNNINCD
jgi:hypothetical protein